MELPQVTHRTHPTRHASHACVAFELIAGMDDTNLSRYDTTLRKNILINWTANTVTCRCHGRSDCGVEHSATVCLLYCNEL